MRNTQEIFDKIAIHLLTQNERSALRNGACCYRVENGNSCAVGCLISDDVYERVGKNIEGMGVTQAPVLEALKDSIGFNLNQGQIQMLSDLQECHDWCKPDEWKEVLKNIAGDYGLRLDVFNHFEAVV